ncbi:MAG: Heme chaperone HemW [Acidobacteriota bacterium]|nr:Heme chaperone HemW [Acidobacteriota bacterium]
MSSSLGLYVHVPFCRTKCRYCDFYRVGENRLKIDLFLAALHREIDGWTALHGRTVETIFFGGGTPSLLAGPEIGAVLRHLEGVFAVAAGAEVTAEANPSDLDPSALAALRAAGVNRLSIGVQSFSDRELTLVGRRHDAARAEQVVRAARQAGFENLSIDLMLAIPGQTEAGFRRTLDKAIALATDHLSLYLLEIHESSEMDFLRRERPRLFPGEEAERRRYLAMHERLVAAGYEHYEISNFARPGKQGRHNLRYWHLEPWLGLGPAAHSFVDGRRFRHPADLGAWLRDPLAAEPLDNDLAQERAMLGLRLEEGIDMETLRAASGASVDELAARLRRLERFVVESAGRIRLTTEGRVVSNPVLTELFF